jgi:hypothetical protein
VRAKQCHRTTGPVTLLVEITEIVDPGSEASNLTCSPDTKGLYISILSPVKCGFVGLLKRRVPAKCYGFGRKLSISRTFAKNSKIHGPFGECQGKRSLLRQGPSILEQRGGRRRTFSQEGPFFLAFRQKKHTKYLPSTNAPYHTVDVILRRCHYDILSLLGYKYFFSSLSPREIRRHCQHDLSRGNKQGSIFFDASESTSSTTSRNRLRMAASRQAGQPASQPG